MLNSLLVFSIQKGNYLSWFRVCEKCNAVTKKKVEWTFCGWRITTSGPRFFYWDDFEWTEGSILSIWPIQSARHRLREWVCQLLGLFSLLWCCGQVLRELVSFPPYAHTCFSFLQVQLRSHEDPLNTLLLPWVQTHGGKAADAAVHSVWWKILRTQCNVGGGKRIVLKWEEGVE